MSFTRRRLRNWAARVLFLWLFGLGVGVAQACLTAPAAADARDDAAAHAQTTAAAHEHRAHDHHGPDGAAEPMAPSVHHADAGAAHHGAGDDGSGASLKSNCSDFCDKAGSSLPSLKYTGNDIQAQALHLPLVAMVAAAPAFAPATQWFPRREGVSAPPIPIAIAFVRLAL